MSDIEARLQRMERILEISHELTAAVSQERLLHQIVEAAVELTDSESAGILLLDERGGELRYAAAASFADQLIAIPVPVEGSIAGAVFSSGEPVIVPDVRADPRYYPVVEEQIGFEVRSLLVVPLQFREHRIGVLEAENKRGEKGFDPEDVDTLTALAAQATVAIKAEIERARLLQAEREQRQLAEALRRAGAALSRTLDFEEVFEQILEQISHVVPQAAANIMLIEGDAVRVLRGYGYEQFGTTAGQTYISFNVDDVSSLREMQQTGQPVIIPDVERDEEWVYSRPEHTWIKSYAGVPIHIRDQVIGFLNVNSAVSGFFSPADAEHLQAFADHAAIAIENARLYDQAQQELAERVRAENELRQHRDHLEELVRERAAELIMAIEQLEEEIHDRMRAEEKLRRRNQELAALNAVSQALSSSLELQDTLDHALSYTVDALGFTGGLITLADERTRDLALFTHTGMPQSLVECLQTQGLSNTPCYSVYLGGSLLVLEDLRENLPANVQVHNLLEAGMRSYAGVPIVYQDRALGTFCVLDTAPHSFSETDYALLTVIGQQMGVAVENARLFRDVVHERQASLTLLDIAKTLSTTLRIDRLLERVLDELQRVVPFDAVSINMVRDERFWTVAFRGMGHIPAGRFFLNEFPLVQRVVSERSPVIVPDMREEPDWFLAGESNLVRSWLGVPLIAKDEAIGVLMMDSHQPYSYGEEAARLALSFAHQVALAIENARLYEQVQAKLRETTLLHSVTGALSFTLDLDRILPYVARSLCEILNGTSVEIYSLDEETSILVCAANHVSFAGTETTETEERLSLKQTYSLADFPAIAECLAQRRPVQARVDDDDPEADPRLQAVLETHDAQSTLLLPMVAGDRALGLAQVWESQIPRRFTEGEITMGQALIHQATITIYNAQLVEALRQHTAELEAQNAELDAFAHTVAHDLKNPLTSLIGYSSILEKRFAKLSEERLQSNLEIIGRNGRRMRNIIDELLLLASVRKMEEVETGPLDMGSIVVEAQERLADPIAEHQAEIVMPDASVWPTAMGYGPWIEEVWANYISNAIKYGGRPPLIELGATEQENGFLRFWVQDNGPGLSSEERAQLFTPFTRLHQVHAEGHGLGLSIVQRIVEKLGGQVGVESAGVSGEGSTFFFTLPTAQQ